MAGQPLTQLVAGGEETFGARHKALVMVSEPGESRWMPHPRRFDEFDPPTLLHGAGGIRGIESAGAFLAANAVCDQRRADFAAWR